MSSPPFRLLSSVGMWDIVGGLVNYEGFSESDLNQTVEKILGHMPADFYIVVAATAYAAFLLNSGKHFVDSVIREENRIKTDTTNSILDFVRNYNNQAPRQTQERFLANIKSSFELSDDINELKANFDTMFDYSVVFMILVIIYTLKSYLPPVELLEELTLIFIPTFGIIILLTYYFIRTQSKRIITRLEI